MKKFYKKKKRGPVQSKKISYDGITFASGLERYMYMGLKKAKIKALYEGETFELQEAFDFPFESFERCGNGKGDYKNRGNKKIGFQSDFNEVSIFYKNKEIDNLTYKSKSEISDEIVDKIISHLN